MSHFSTPLRRLLPALALLGSLALTACFDKDCDPKPNHHGKCGSSTPPPAPTTTGPGGSN